MKLGVVSDVHNNVAALSYALEQLANCDQVVSLGDLISDYHVAPEIIRLAREAQLLGIKGNHEKTLFLHPGSRMLEKLSAEDAAYLHELPPQRAMTLAGRRVLLAHGAPWDDPNEYRCHYLWARDQRDLNRLHEVDADIVLVGHTHHAMTLQVGPLTLINPGSCGEGRDQARRLSFAELDFDRSMATVFEIRSGEPPARMFQTPI